MAAKHSSRSFITRNLKVPAQHAWSPLGKHSRLFVQLFKPQQLELISDLVDADVTNDKTRGRLSGPSSPETIVRPDHKRAEESTKLRGFPPEPQFFHQRLGESIRLQNPK
jgi:hypothetical protein